MKRNPLPILIATAASALLVCACASDRSNVNTVDAGAEQNLSGRELFFADSLNAYFLDRTYPVPDVNYTPAPKGYRPVYISTYGRHGSRKMHMATYAYRSLSVLSRADSLGLLTPLGQDIMDKVKAISQDMQGSVGELTEAGTAQHRDIAERLYRNFPEVFSAKGTQVRLYSTAMQRTMMSMFACNERLLELNPTLQCTRKASESLAYLRRDKKVLPDMSSAQGLNGNFVREYFDTDPVLERLFTGEVPGLTDPSKFVLDLYCTGGIVRGLDIGDVDFIWDLFTYEELFLLQQAENLSMYANYSNSPEFGPYNLMAISPLLQDFIDKANAALEDEAPSADLRFGHDSYLSALTALLGAGGYVTQEEDPLKVIDVYQDFRIIPMAANLQWIFYRNRSGEVLVKILQNERESSLPIPTDTFPYYRWSDLREYCLGRIARYGYSVSELK